MDNNYRSFAGERNQTYESLTLDPENPLQYSDICKLSDTDGNTYRGFFFAGGKEDCIDINRGSKNNAFFGGRLQPHGKFGITVKGNADGNVFDGIVFLSHGTEMDIDVGNDSEQSMNWTKGLVFNDIHAADGRPVRLRVGWGSKPKITNSNIKYLFWQSLGLKIYVVFMWAKRKLVRQK